MDLFKQINEKTNLTEFTGYLGIKGVQANRFTSAFKKALEFTLKVKDEDGIVVQKVREVSAARIAKILVNTAKIGKHFIFVLSAAGSETGMQRLMFTISNSYEFIKRIAPNTVKGSSVGSIYVITDLRAARDGQTVSHVSADVKELYDAIRSVSNHRLLAYNITVSQERKMNVPFNLLDMEETVKGEIETDPNIEDDISPEVDEISMLDAEREIEDAESEISDKENSK